MGGNATNSSNLEDACVNKDATFYPCFAGVVSSPVYFLMFTILIFRFKLRLPRHKILLSLTISDSIQIVTVALLPLSVVNTSIISTGCQVLRKVLGYNGILTVVSSSGSILLLSWERYVACVHCFRFHSIVTHEMVNKLVCCVWALSFICGFLEKERYEENLSPVMVPFLKTDTLIYVVTVLSSSVVLLVVQVRLYLMSYKKTNVLPGGINFGRKAEEYDTRRSQIKLAVVASAIVVLYMDCMGPMAVYLLSTGMETRYDQPTSRQITSRLVMINALVDPFVYGLGMADTRQAIIRELKGIKSYFVNLLTNITTILSRK